MHTICVKLTAVCSCVQKDPVSRLSVTQIAQLPFVQDFVTNQLPGILKADQSGAAAAEEDGNEVDMNATIPKSLRGSNHIKTPSEPPEVSIAPNRTAEVHTDDESSRLSAVLALKAHLVEVEIQVNRNYY